MNQRTCFFLVCLCTVVQCGWAQNASDVLEQALSGVVTVAVYQSSDVNSRPLGVRGSKVNVDQAYAKALSLTGAKSSGSGFIVESGGQKYVLTNAHVVESANEEAGSIAVFSVNQQKYPVRVVGGDALYDFAVLAFINQPGPELTALPLRALPGRIGERVYAIGNPQGEYPYTVTDGIISAKNRARGGVTGKFGFLQTTATVIWGNSGGPLVDEQGAVLGINSQIAFADSPDGSQIWLSQINFALETPIVQRLLDDVLTNDGLVRRAYLGLEFSQTANDKQSPPILSAILPDSPGQATLSKHIRQPVRAVNGEEVRSVEELLGVLESVRPGGTVALTFDEGQTTTTVSVTATTLAPPQLESLARYVLNSSKLTLSNVPEGIAVQFKQDENTYELNQERKFQKAPKSTGKPMVRPASVNTPVSVPYRVVAAGIHSNRANKLWRVGKLSYLGAVCRLMGLAGVVDLAVVDPNDPDSLRFVRKILSGDEDDIRSYLWY